MSDGWLAEFEHRHPGSGRSRRFIDGLRAEAMRRFSEKGLPTTDQEDWRYTSTEEIAKRSFVLAEPDPLHESVEDDFVKRSDFVSEGDVCLVFMNGHFSPRFSRLEGLPPSIKLRRIEEVLAHEASVLEPHLFQVAKSEDRPFVSLNTAFLQDGICLTLPAGVAVERPIYICHLSWQGQGTALSEKIKTPFSCPRNLIILGEGSAATVVEIYAGGGNGDYLTNAVTEIVMGPGSSVDHYKLEQEGNAAFHVGSLDAQQGRESRFRSTVLSFGGRLCRSEVRTVLAEVGAECELNGLFMVTGRQHADCQTSIDHAMPHGTSAELYKGILGGQATGVFNGRVIVRPGAQKTNARQMNKNLLLSKEALVNTKPLLEILANDVQCRHGATIGRLDEGQIFYLRSRGLSENHAKSLLTYAFASQIVGDIRIPSFRQAMEKTIFRKLLASELVEGGLT